MKVSVLGAGGWGTTLAVLLHYNGHSVTLWEYKKAYAKELAKHRENRIYLPGINIPDEIKITSDIEDSTNNKNLIVLAVPSQFLRKVIERIDYHAIKDTILVSVSKGIEKETLMTISQMMKDVHHRLDKIKLGFYRVQVMPKKFLKEFRPQLLLLQSVKKHQRQFSQYS